MHFIGFVVVSAEGLAYVSRHAKAQLLVSERNHFLREGMSLVICLDHTQLLINDNVIKAGVCDWWYNVECTSKSSVALRPNNRLAQPQDNMMTLRYVRV